jgi:hypothetical protein
MGCIHAKGDTEMTKSRIDERLGSLRSEQETGQKMLAELDAKRNNLTATLARIEGAIQVLQELLAEEAPEQANGSGAA